MKLAHGISVFTTIIALAHSQAPDECPQWSAWRTSDCWWPANAYESYPCAGINPNYRQFPVYLQQFFTQTVSRSWYETEIAEYTTRGSPPPCGFCSTRWRCRQRLVSIGQQLPDHCQFFEENSLPERDCPGRQPCEITPADGMCTPPGFLEHDIAVLGRWYETGGERFSYERFGSKSGALGIWSWDMMILEQIAKDLPEEMMAVFMGKLYRFKHLIGLLTQTNCIKNTRDGSRCACCCAPYVPDLATNRCIDATATLSSEVDQLLTELSAMEQADTGAAAGSPADSIATILQQFLNTLGGGKRK